MPSEDSADRWRDHYAVRLWIQLEHRLVEVPLRTVLDWTDQVRVEVSEYVQAISALEVHALERGAVTVPAVLREYVHHPGGN